jgi:hypothetical protein
MTDLEDYLAFQQLLRGNVPIINEKKTKGKNKNKSSNNTLNKNKTINKKPSNNKNKIKSKTKNRQTDLREFCSFDGDSLEKMNINNLNEINNSIIKKESEDNEISNNYSDKTPEYLKSSIELIENNRLNLKNLNENISYSNYNSDNYHNPDIQSDYNGKSLEDLLTDVDNSKISNENVECSENPWKSTLEPMVNEIINKFGEPDPPLMCFGCKRGKIGQAATNFENWNKMINLFLTGYLSGNWVALAEQLYIFFEKSIRRPANKLKQFYQEEIPEWTASTIFFHFYEHLRDATIIYAKRLYQISTMLDYHIKYNTYEQNIYNKNQYRVKSDELKTLKELLTLERQCLNSNPNKSIFNNPSLTLKAELTTSFLNPERPYYMKNMDTDLFKNRTNTYHSK